MFITGTRVKLTDKGKKECTSQPVEKQDKDYIFKGTVEKIIYVVKMDDKGFHSFTYGNGYNTFTESALEKL
jgi:hypothetical protein